MSDRGVLTVAATALVAVVATIRWQVQPSRCAVAVFCLGVLAQLARRAVHRGGSPVRDAMWIDLTAGSAIVGVIVMAGSFALARAATPVAPVSVERCELTSDVAVTWGEARATCRLARGRAVEIAARGGVARSLLGAGWGDRLVVSGTAGPPDTVPWRLASGRVVTVELGAAELADGPVWWRRPAIAAREAVIDGLADVPLSREPLARGLVLGDDSGQAPLQKAAFRWAGMSHLLAVSGQNVAFVLTVAAPLTSRLTRRPRLLVTLGVLVVFAMATRLEPSVLRAVAMAAVGASAAYLGRFTTRLRVVALAVLGLLALDPLIAVSLGFQLSVVATWALAAWAAPLARSLKGPEVLRRAVAASAVAWVATAPLLVGLGDVPVSGFIVNLVAVPAAGLVMLVGMSVVPVVGVLTTVVPDAWPLRWVTGRCIGVVAALLDTLARVGSHPAGPALDAAGVVGVGVAIVAARWLPRGGWLAATLVAALLWRGTWPVTQASTIDVSPGVSAIAGTRRGLAEVRIDGRAAPQAVIELARARRSSRIDVLVVVGTSATVQRTAAVVGEWCDVGRVVRAPSVQR